MKALPVRSRILIMLGVASIGAGCANDTIRVRNNDAITPAGRVIWQVGAPNEKTSLGLAWSGVTVEGEVSYTEGKDHQTVELDDQVTLDGTTIPGPTQLRTRARVVDVTADIRTGLAIQDMIRVEALVGVEVATVELEIASAGAQASDLNPSVGVLLGVRAGLQPHRLVELYGLATVGTLGGTRGSNEAMATSKTELGARLLPLEHSGVFVAYRWADFNQVRDSDESDAELSFRGPVLGLEARF